ncbi:NAD(P)H-hydrate dehydratase [Elstera cyanobacteriorum]|uniref:NAD(P)H-hydrate dehydratase n=1 Tax=Elstera cyanobacteriorum TaxID=2022747 RepID=UPI002355870A|nr:NAD(P)H-hydrate dehydratase [Elstera cyanobacteriorum]MCK6443502.1 NAD(P)H-hydrate dehydratase [Elstera cyanobacteriorum]
MALDLLTVAPDYPLDLLTPAQMGAVDAQAAVAGLAVFDLMECAGTAVAEVVQARWTPRLVLVLCGPGNNGGDGWVAARRLRDAGWPVRLVSLVPLSALTGAAAAHAARWPGPVEVWEGAGPSLGETALIVDALFGAGLTRPLPPAVRRWLARTAALPLVAVDVPSGLDGGTGVPLGWAPQAALTVTFHRYKPGHFIMPGKSLCGDLHLIDIGIPANIRPPDRIETQLNHRRLWQTALRPPRLADHKFTRGWAMIRAGHPESGGMAGAAILSSRAARRVGAGLVSLVTPTALSDWPGTLVTTKPWGDACAEKRATGFLLGPGNGVGPATVAAVLAAAATGVPLVLDADAVTSFAGGADQLRRGLAGPCVLTPHEGEFARLFAGTPVDLTQGRLSRARQAARWMGATIVLKGPDTLIAHPDGRVIVQPWAPPALATAGSGDVLAGIILGLMAQGISALDAAAAGVWLHAAAGQRAGAHGMIAEDLVDFLPEILDKFIEKSLY